MGSTPPSSRSREPAGHRPRHGRAPVRGWAAQRAVVVAAVPRPHARPGGGADLLGRRWAAGQVGLCADHLRTVYVDCCRGHHRGRRLTALAPRTSRSLSSPSICSHDTRRRRQATRWSARYLALWAAVRIRAALPSDRDAVTGLWALSGLTRPWNDPDLDFDRALAGATSAVLSGVEDGAIIATVMVGHDGHRGWVYYLAVHPERRNERLGQQMMRAAEDWLRVAGPSRSNSWCGSRTNKRLGSTRRWGTSAPRST
jgi:GNAT superfamily N-acetyltransferase